MCACSTGLAIGSTSSETLGFLATWQRLAGEEEHFKETLAKIRELQKAQPELVASHWPIAKVLFLNDQPREAIDLFIHNKDYLGAFDLLYGQSRFQEAFALLKQARENPPTDPGELELHAVRALNLLGETNPVAGIVAQFDERTKPADGPVDRKTALERILLQRTGGLEDQALDASAKLLANQTEEPARHEVWRALFDAREPEAAAWWKLFRQKNPPEEIRKTLDRIAQVLRGGLTTQEIAALTREAESTSEKLGAAEQANLWQALGIAVWRTGHMDAALGWFRKAAQITDTTENWLVVAGLLTRQKQWKEAAERWQQIWEKDKTRPESLYLEGWALVQNGAKDAGQAKMHQARLLLLVNEDMPNEEAQSRFAEILQTQGLREAALREFTVLVRTSTWAAQLDANLWKQLTDAAIEKRDFATAIRRTQGFLFSCLHAEVSFTESLAYLHVPSLLHSQRACAALGAGHPDEAKREMLLALDAVPDNVEAVIMVTPEFEKCGRKQDADEIFNRIFALHEKICSEFPRSAKHHNNLAWLASRLGRNLDKALTHAQRAVELEPENHGYLDTLADVWFRKGEKAKAVALMKKCLELEPHNDFYPKHLSEFESPDTTAAPQKP